MVNLRQHEMSEELINLKTQAIFVSEGTLLSDVLKCLLASINQYYDSDLKKKLGTTDVSYHIFTSVCLSIGFCFQVNYEGAIHRHSSFTDGNRCCGKTSQILSACG